MSLHSRSKALRGSGAAAWLAALLLGWGPAARAHAQAPVPPRAERSLLTLNDGRILRGLARENDGHWEVREGALWLALPEGSVRRARSERDVLAELASLSAAVHPSGDAQRGDTQRGDSQHSDVQHGAVQQVELARWMLEQGLFAEALSELDLVLDRDPDQRDARALLLNNAPPVAFPAAVDDAELTPALRCSALVHFAEQGRGSVRELALTRLASLSDKSSLHTLLERELVSGVIGRRTFAILALRRAFPGEHVRELLQRAALDPSEDVRDAACTALRELHDPAVIQPLARALASKNAATRIHSATALGELAAPRALEPLTLRLSVLAAPGSGGGGGPRANLYVGNQTSYLQDFDVEIAQAASIAKPIVAVQNDGVVLDVRVGGVSSESTSIGSERRAVCRALARISGQNFGDEPDRWLAWWKDHKGTASSNTADNRSNRDH